MNPGSQVQDIGAVLAQEPRSEITEDIFDERTKAVLMTKPAPGGVIDNRVGQTVSRYREIRLPTVAPHRQPVQHATIRNRINVRRRQVLAALDSEISITEVIGDDQKKCQVCTQQLSNS